MRKFLTLFIILFCLIGETIHAVDAELEEVKVKRIPYITLESFAKKYSLSYPKEITKEPFEVKNEKQKFFFRLESRECRYNNILYWLSLPLIENDDRILISKVDAYKLLMPLLEPKNIGPKMLILGVIIDPGHGGENKGTVACNGLTEKEMNLDVARLLKEELRREGIPSVMTRNSDKDLSLEERAKFTERYPAYLFVSIHHNEGNTTSRGIETFCLTPENAVSTNDGGIRLVKRSQFFKGNFYDSANLLLASLVHREMVKLHPPEADRGVKRARFVVLKQARTPSVLVEAGFMSHAGDLALIKSLKYRAKVAEKIAVAIKRFIRIMNNTKVPPQKMRRPADRGVEFTKPSTLPLRKGEIVPPSETPAPTPVATPPPSPEEKSDTQNQNLEDGRGEKESVPADEIQTILQDKVQKILKEEQNESPQKVEETVLSTPEDTKPSPPPPSP